MTVRGELRSMVAYVILCGAGVAWFGFGPTECLFVGVTGLALKWGSG